MTEDEVRAVLAGCGADASRFPWRLGPQDGQEAPEGTFIWPVELADGRYLACSFSFGKEDPDPALSWKPSWRKVEGPMTLAELQALGRKK